MKTVVRYTTGRFSVELPFRTIVCPTSTPGIQNQAFQESVGLGSSRTLTLNRLYNLERRLAKDGKLYEAYRVYMDEYFELGHMSVATESNKYFIPHHPVVKHTTTGLKIHVVFNTFAPSLTGLSLNDCLVIGPV